jgi:tetratricopeptide (TPR) repeat protein
LIEEKTRAAVNAENTVKEKEKFEEELRELRKTHAALQEMMQNPHKAYDAHIKGANELQKVLCDIGTLQALGHNRIQAALDDFKNLNYAAVDQLLQDSERQGILQAARSAFGRGVNSEAAIKYHDAYSHFKRAYELGQGKTELYAYARLCWELGEYGEAEPMLKKLCEWEKEDFGVNHAAYARALNNLAELYRAQGRHDEAEPLHDQAKEIWRTALGEDHPPYATSLNNLGVLYVEQGRLDKVAPLLQGALAILEKALPADHAHTQSTRSRLDRLYAERPDLRDGAEMS